MVSGDEELDLLVDDAAAATIVEDDDDDGGGGGMARIVAAPLPPKPEVAFNDVELTRAS